MEHRTLYFDLSYLVAATFLILSITNTQAFASAGEVKKSNGLQHRIDFGSAHILGQSIKSGAVYLLHRKQSDIKGMLEVRQNYRKEIIEDFDLEASAIIKDGSEKLTLD
jgi:hypothetical protein